jgi:GDP-4-dehydro-6-deoxy-D-mannose reductase
MRVFVTGADGFVGQYLMPSLEKAGHETYGCDRNTVDIRDPKALRGAVDGFQPDAVIHLAAISFIPHAIAEPDLTEQINIGGTHNLIESMLAVCPDARLLLIGSSEQYSSSKITELPISEEAPLTGTGAYAESKTAAEKIAIKAQDRGLNLVRVRAFNHTGPGQAPQFVAPDFSRQVALIEAGAPAQMRVGNLDSTRDFLHVQDVVDAYLCLLDPSVPVDAYNVSTGQPTRIGEVLERLIAMSTRTVAVETDPQRWREPDARVGDSRRLRHTTGWEPRYSVPDILSELLDYWRSQVARSGTGINHTHSS